MGKAKWSGAWHVNVGVRRGIIRNWDDAREYGFLSAGQGDQFSNQIRQLSVGDEVFAYLNGSGYVGGGIITTPAVRANSFVPPGFDISLRDLPVKSQWFTKANDPEYSEYIVGIKWSKTVAAGDGFRVPAPMRGTARRIWKAELAAQLRHEFDLTDRPRG
jgi:hypothetical protein